MRGINKIYLHISDSTWGSEQDIGWWHKLRGFGSSFRGQYTVYTGYHFIILNGDVSSGCGEELKVLDGSIEVGRRLEQIGAHTHGDNAETIGICMIGKRTKDGTPFTVNQILSSFKLIAELLEKYKLTTECVWGHYEYYVNNKLPVEKWCPDIDMKEYRRLLADYLTNPQNLIKKELLDFQQNVIFKLVG